jgi:hypothetical protein
VAVTGYRVDLIRGVSTVDQSFPTAAAAKATNEYDVTCACRPLALHPYEVASHVEDEVVSLIGKRPGNTDSELEGDRGDLGLRDRAFLIRRQHPPTLAAASDEVLPNQ